MADISLIKQGAEARVYKTNFMGKSTIVKERFRKAYRHPTLDEKLTQRRILQEVRAICRARKSGIPTPVIYHVDTSTGKIYMEYIGNSDTARSVINKFLQDSKLAEQKTVGNVSEEKLQSIACKIGSTVAKLHASDLIHGDLTTSNLLISDNLDRLTVIDFGLSFVSSLAEDKGVDLYVLERAFLGTHPNTEELFVSVLESYRKNSDPAKANEVIKKLDEVRLRGRKREMIG